MLSEHFWHLVLGILPISIYGFFWLKSNHRLGHFGVFVIFILFLFTTFHAFPSALLIEHHTGRATHGEHPCCIPIMEAEELDLPKVALDQVESTQVLASQKDVFIGIINNKSPPVLV